MNEYIIELRINYLEVEVIIVSTSSTHGLVIIEPTAASIVISIASLESLSRGSLHKLSVGAGDVGGKSLSTLRVHFDSEFHLLTISQRTKSLGVDL